MVLLVIPEYNSQQKIAIKNNGLPEIMAARSNALSACMPRSRVERCLSLFNNLGSICLPGGSGNLFRQVPQVPSGWKILLQLVLVRCTDDMWRPCKAQIRH